LALATELSIVKEKALQKSQEIKELNQRLEKLINSYSLLDKEYRLTKPLIKSGAVSEVEVIRLQRSLGDLDGEISEVKLALPRLESELNEAKGNLKRAKEVFKIEAQGELNKTLAEISQLQESVGALGDRVQRTIVRAPVKGTIKQVNITTVGGVVQPGMDLIEIVPFEDKLFVEVKINPKDVAFIHPGQNASVKVTAYDFSIHGDLKGAVINISPDTVTDKEGNNFYIIKIETENAFFEKNGKKLPIIPGMIVEANIVTGQKTIMNYLLKPILKTKQLALRER
jgi:adhesin transport system membrane fusion protein